MHRIDGLWRVDIASTYKNIYTPSPGKTFYLRNRHHPYAFAFTDIWSDIHDYAEPIDLGNRKIADVLGKLEHSKEPQDIFKFAEVLYRNAYVAAEALIYYDQAAEALPNDFDVQCVYAKRLIYEGAPKKAIDILTKLDTRAYALLGDAWNSLQNYDKAIHYYEMAQNQHFDNARALQGYRRLQRTNK